MLNISKTAIVMLHGDDEGWWILYEHIWGILVVVYGLQNVANPRKSSASLLCHARKIGFVVRINCWVIFIMTQNYRLTHSYLLTIIWQSRNVCPLSDVSIYLFRHMKHLECSDSKKKIYIHICMAYITGRLQPVIFPSAQFIVLLEWFTWPLTFVHIHIFSIFRENYLSVCQSLGIKICFATKAKLILYCIEHDTSPIMSLAECDSSFA